MLLADTTMRPSHSASVYVASDTSVSIGDLFEHVAKSCNMSVEDESQGSSPNPQWPRRCENEVLSHSVAFIPFRCGAPCLARDADVPAQMASSQNAKISEQMHGVHCSNIDTAWCTIRCPSPAIPLFLFQIQRAIRGRGGWRILPPSLLFSPDVVNDVRSSSAGLCQHLRKILGADCDAEALMLPDEALQERISRLKSAGAASLAAARLHAAAATVWPSIDKAIPRQWPTD